MRSNKKGIHLLGSRRFCFLILSILLVHPLAYSGINGTPDGSIQISQAVSDIANQAMLSIEQSVSEEYKTISILGINDHSNIANIDRTDILQFMGQKVYSELFKQSKNRSHPSLSIRNDGDFAISGTRTT